MGNLDLLIPLSTGSSAKLSKPRPPKGDLTTALAVLSSLNVNHETHLCILAVGPSRTWTPFARHSSPSACPTFSTSSESNDAASPVAHGKQEDGVPAKKCCPRTPLGPARRGSRLQKAAIPVCREGGLPSETRTEGIPEEGMSSKCQKSYRSQAAV